MSSVERSGGTFSFHGALYFPVNKSLKFLV
jgi:hypothetical protein